MGLSSTNLRLTHANDATKTYNLKIKCGIFQRDLLSPPLFYLSSTPLSIELKKTFDGYETMDKSIIYLFYMDDLKFFQSIIVNLHDYWVR